MLGFLHPKLCTKAYYPPYQLHCDVTSNSDGKAALYIFLRINDLLTKTELAQSPSLQLTVQEVAALPSTAQAFFRNHVNYD